MRKGIVVTALAVVVAVLGLVGSPKESDAAFHLMRIYGVMGGALQDTRIQYIELRQTTGGQNIVANHDICFFNADGTPYAIFNFPSNAPSGTNPSILAGSSEFDAAWAAGTLDGSPTPAIFNGSTVTAIETGADVFHPIRLPAGKIVFGTESSLTPASMCSTMFSPIDSVAYGTGYTGPVNYGGMMFGTKFNTDMPKAGTQAVRLQGSVCTPGFNCPTMPPYVYDNSVNYALVNVNASSSDYPRNNVPLSGQVTPADTDSDGVSDVSPSPPDLCPGTAPAAAVDTVGCSQAQVDSDLDGWCNPGAPGPGSPACTPTDNCPDWENPLQELPTWTMPSGDTDCDGYHATTAFGARAPEATIGTVATAHCSATPTGFDEPLPDAWPPDFNDNQLVNGQDILSFNNVFGQPTGNPPITYGGSSVPVTRWDLNASGLVNGSDILQLNPFFSLRCKPLP